MRRLIATACLALCLAVAGRPALAQEPSALAQAHVDWRDRISVQTVGEGDDVVLIPGLASAPDVFASLVAALRGSHRLHLVHVRGFAGLAPPADTSAVLAPLAEAVAAYLEEGGIEDAAIIGHSMGGATGLALAARHDGLVGRVLVVDALPFYSLLFGPTVTVEAMTPQADAAMAFMLAQSPEQYAAFQTRGAAMLAINPVARQRMVDASLQSDRAVTACAVRDVMVTDLRPELPAIKDPVTVLYAWDATMGVPQVAVDGLYGNAYRDLPGVRLQRIDQSYHFIMDDQPEAWLAAVRAFLGTD